MLKIAIEDNGPSHVQCEGSGTQLLAELAGAVRVLQARINPCNPKAAKAFRRKLIRLLNDPESPVWDADTTDLGEGFSACIPIQKKEDN